MKFQVGDKVYVNPLKSCAAEHCGFCYKFCTVFAEHGPTDEHYLVANSSGALDGFSAHLLIPAVPALLELYGVSSDTKA